MNLPIIGIIAIGGYFLFNKYMNVNTFTKAFDYRYTVKNFKFWSLTEIRFNLEITILNPSTLGLTVTNPLVQVFYDGSQLARSEFNIPTMSVKPLAQTVLPLLEFRINLISNWYTIKKILDVLLKGVSLVNITQTKDILSKNQAAFLKLLNAQFTGYINGTPFTKSFNLG